MSQLDPIVERVMAGYQAPDELTPARHRPQAIDVVELARSADMTGEPMVLEDLIPLQAVISVTGEEGEGKTTIADQAGRQMMRREPALGMFAPGMFAPERLLFVDTEQEEAEVRRRGAEMDRRGLAVPPGKMFWLWAGGLNLAGSKEDRLYIRAEIERVGADFVWIDAGSNALDDPKDDGSTRAFFNYLSTIMRAYDLKAQGLTLHPRKRAQGEYGRRFDDLFGSREWKGRSTKALYIDGSTVVAWKDRGGSLRKVWPNRAAGRYPKAQLYRPGLDDEQAVPFLIEPGEPEAAVDVEALEARVLDLVAGNPEHYTKNSLAQALGGRKQEALQVIGHLVAEGRLGPDKARAKLSLPEGSGDDAV